MQYANIALEDAKTFLTLNLMKLPILARSKMILLSITASMIP
jgi:hypothetical protein